MFMPPSYSEENRLGYPGSATWTHATFYRRRIFNHHGEFALWRVAVEADSRYSNLKTCFIGKAKWNGLGTLVICCGVVPNDAMRPES